MTAIAIWILLTLTKTALAVLARACTAGVGLVIVPCIEIETAQRVLDLTDRHSNVYAAVGVHPNSCAEFEPKSVDALRELAHHPKVVAVGEIGLDYHWQKVSPEQQHKALWAQLELAEELGLPVIIHNRNSDADLAEILARWVGRPRFLDSPLAARPFAGVLHAFGGDLELARQAYRWNFVLGLGGSVTFKNARTYHALIPQLRRDRILLETDAPYLTPHPHRGTRNEPAYVALVRDKLAALFNLTPQAVEIATTDLALRFFGLENVYRAGHASPPQTTRA